MNMPGEIYPDRQGIEWITTTSGNIEIIMKKDLNWFEKKVAYFIGAPTIVRRPLDEMNSKLWTLMDGTRTLDQIIIEMDQIFKENIAPVTDRVTRSIAIFVESGLVSLNREMIDDQSE